MIKQVWLKLAFLAVALATAPFSANANLLLNGSFENGTWTASGAGWMTVAPGSTAITGWTVGGVGVDWHNSVEFQPIQNGQYAVDLNHAGGGLPDTGTISQIFATLAGQTYHLSFYLAGPNQGFPDPRLVNVNVNGVDTVFSQSASNNLDLNWGLRGMDFVATGSSSTLTFSSLNGAGYWGPVLDNVSVDAVVPEPASLALLGLGFLGLAFSRRKKA